MAFDLIRSEHSKNCLNRKNISVVCVIMNSQGRSFSLSTASYNSYLISKVLLSALTIPTKAIYIDFQEFLRLNYWNFRSEWNLNNIGNILIRLGFEIWDSIKFSSFHRLKMNLLSFSVLYFNDICISFKIRKLSVSSISSSHENKFIFPISHMLLTLLNIIHSI